LDAINVLLLINLLDLFELLISLLPEKYKSSFSCCYSVSCCDGFFQLCNFLFAWLLGHLQLMATEEVWITDSLKYCNFALLMAILIFFMFLHKFVNIIASSKVNVLNVFKTVYACRYTHIYIYIYIYIYMVQSWSRASRLHF
jgi:hypothetical protein